MAVIRIAQIWSGRTGSSNDENVRSYKKECSAADRLRQDAPNRHCHARHSRRWEIYVEPNAPLT